MMNKEQDNEEIKNNNPYLKALLFFSCFSPKKNPKPCSKPVAFFFRKPNPPLLVFPLFFFLSLSGPPPKISPSCSQLLPKILQCSFAPKVLLLLPQIFLSQLLSVFPLHLLPVFLSFTQLSPKFPAPFPFLKFQTAPSQDHFFSLFHFSFLSKLKLASLYHLSLSLSLMSHLAATPQFFSFFLQPGLPREMGSSLVFFFF